MKIAELATGFALLGAFWGTTVCAEETSVRLRQPDSIAQVATAYDSYYDYDYYDASSTSADQLSQAPVVQVDPGIFRRWQARDPWTLPQPYLLQRLGVNSGGWLQVGITANAEDPADRSNGPILMNDRHGEFQMHQLWLYFERPCDTGGYGFDIGGRVDLFYGTDFRFAVCHGQGLEDRINGLDRLYGFAVPQFYVEAAVNRLSVKIGRMGGVLGYEMIPPMGNFFYSHSYTICYTEPLLIAGVMGKYQLTDQWTALAGFHRGVRRFEDNNNDLNFQGGLAWNSWDQRTSLAYALDAGPNDDAGLRDEYVHSLVFKRQLTEKALYVIQNNLGFRNGVAGEDDAEWYSIAQYLLYTLNQRWSAGLRIEWFRDDDGVRIAGLGNLPEARGWLSPGGYAGNFTELTIGLNWKPKANVIFRPELRWDWYDGPPSTIVGPGGVYPFPFDGGNSRTQFTAAADLVVTF